MEERSLVSSDTIVGIVGAVILTGAMVAVFYYEADRDTGTDSDIGSGSQQFQARFVDHGDHAPSVDEDITLQEGGEWSQALQVPPYSFGIHVEVSWDEHEFSAVVGSPSFTIEILDEDGNVVGSDDGSPFHHGMDDNRSRPAQMNLTVSADDEAQAQEFLDQYMQSPEVQQNARSWTVRVTLDDDGLDDPTGQVEDIERTGTVTVQYEHYALELFSGE